MKCIAIDFDYTLVHFSTSSRGFFRLFTKYGATEVVLKKAYETVAHSKEQKGFDFESMFEEVAKETANLFPHQHALRRAFDGWLKTNLVLYSDSRSALNEWRDELHLPVCIVTAGAEKYQRRKIKLMQVPRDKIIVVPHTKEKVTAIKELLGRCGGPIVFIDDKVSELDAVHEAGIGKEVLTVHIKRPRSPYRDQKAKYGHLEVPSLTDNRLAAVLKNYALA